MVLWFVAPSYLGLFDWGSKEVYQAVRFEKENRYYVIRLEKDLLEDWTITIVNGRIKSKLGQSRTQAFPSYSKAFDQFCNLAKPDIKEVILLKHSSVSPLLFYSCSLPYCRLTSRILQIPG